MPPCRTTGVVSSLGECPRECLEVVGALGEHQAVTTVSQGSGDVLDDLAGSGGVGGEVAVDGGDAAGSGRVEVAGVAEPGGVQVQHRRGCCGVGCPDREGAGEGSADGVAGGAELQADQVVELVASVGGGGQTEPAAGRDLADGVLERRGGYVVAFIDHDQPVPGGEFRKVVAS